MAKLCKTRIPPEIRRIVETAKQEKSEIDSLKDAGVEIGLRLCKKLLENDVPGLHFYTLNLEDVVVRILEGLNLVKTANA